VDLTRSVGFKTAAVAPDARESTGRRVNQWSMRAGVTDAGESTFSSASIWQAVATIAAHDMS
jgi:hypothetical protein